MSVRLNTLAVRMRVRLEDDQDTSIEWRALLGAVKGLLKHKARRVPGNEDAAYEEMCITLWRAVRDYEPGRSFAAYLKVALDRTTANVARGRTHVSGADVRYRWSTRTTIEDAYSVELCGLGEDDEVETSEGTHRGLASLEEADIAVDELVIAKDIAVRIMDRVGPENGRIVLLRMAGESVRDIAAVIGVSESTVHYRLRGIREDEVIRGWLGLDG